MLIHNATFTGSFSYNGVDISTITSSVDTSASFATRVASLESTASVLTAASGTLDARVISLESTASILTAASASLSTTSGSLNATSASLSTASGSLNAGLVNVIARTGSFATTGSNVFYGNQTVSASMFVSGSITATGQIVAQTINVQSVTSSVVYSSGSNVFGNDVSNTQVFTGSMLVTGSVNVTGRVFGTSTACFGGAVCAPILFVTSSRTDFISVFQNTNASNPYTLRVQEPASAASGYPLLQVTNNAGSVEYLRVDSCGAVGINQSPSSAYRLSVTGNTCFGGMSIVTNCVGINIAAPVDRLHVNGNIISEGCFFSGAPDNLRIFAGHWSTVSGNGNCYLVLQAGGGSAAFGTPQGWGGTASIYTCNQTRLSINTNGIACFSCQVCAPLLRVQTAGGEAEAIRHSNATVNNWSIGTDASCNAFFQTFEAAKCLILSTGGSGAARLTINGCGNVGIGCNTPTNSRLLVAGTHVSGNSILSVVPVSNNVATIGLYNSSGVRTALFYSDTGFVTVETDTDPLLLRTAGTNRLAISSTGISCFACRVCAPSLTIAGTIVTTASPGAYEACINYLGTTYSFGAAETGDTVDFKICGASASTTGNRFGFWTQAGNATPVERLRIDKNGIACFACTVCAPLHVGNVRGQATIKKAVGSMNGGGSSQLIYLTSNIQADYGINDYSISVFSAGNSAEQSSLRALAAYGYYASSVTTTELAKFLSSPDAHSQLSFGICKLGSSNTYCYAVFFAKSSGTISGYCVTVTFNGITAGGAGDASTY